MELKCSTSKLGEQVIGALPKNFQGIITHVSGENVDNFSCILRLDINTKEKAEEWLESYQSITHTEFKTRETFPGNTVKNLFKKKYRCQHNTLPKSSVTKPHAKHTGCTAAITIKVKQQSMKRSKDQYLKKYPCEIQINSCHNHPINNTEALRLRTANTKWEEIFSSYFAKHHSPSSAHESYKLELQKQFGSDYNMIAAEGFKWPTRNWCNDLYYKMFKKEYGEPTEEDMIKALEGAVNDYNIQSKTECAVFKKTPESLVVAICSPLMKRTFSLNSASEVMFMHSSGNVGRQHSRIFILLTASVIGAIPVGIIVTQGDNEASITEGLQQLKTLWPKYAVPPKIFITDDNTVERNSLRTVFPDSTLFLSTFHILQAVWRYLTDNKHKIDQHDRPYLYSQFKGIVDSETAQIFKMKFDELVKSEIAKKYQNYIQYVCNYKARASEWAMFAREKFLTKNNDTNNCSELSIRALKNKVLERTKAFNIVQMLDFLTRPLNSYYERKLIDAVNDVNRKKGSTRLKSFISNSSVGCLKCKQIDDVTYEVLSKGKTYLVNSIEEKCTCSVGKKGVPCKHQRAVTSTFYLLSEQFLPITDPGVKQMLYFMATGQTLEEDRWCDDLWPTRATRSNVNDGKEGEEEPVEPQNVVVEKVEIYGEEMETDGEEMESYGEEMESYGEEMETYGEEKETSGEKMETNKTMNDLKQVFHILQEKLRTDPERFHAPIKHFVELFENMKTDSNLISALQTFGKYNAAAVPPIKAGENLQGGKVIGVQPTSVARRKYLGGRRQASSGRSPKCSGEDHSYNKKKTSFPEVRPTKEKAPHSLDVWITDNITLG